MPHPWQYPRWRRIVMQMMMWLVLAATVGLAALLNHQRRQALRAPLGPERTLGDLKVRLPRNWTIEEDPAGVPLVALAREMRHERPVRKLEILRLPLGEFSSPLDAILRLQPGRALSEELLRQQSEGGEGVEPLQIGSWPGVMLALESAPDLAEGEVPRKEVVAATVLPSRQAVVVRLVGLGGVDPSDREIVRQVAQSLSFPGQVRPADTGGELLLHDGIELPVPDSFLKLNEPDPNRIARQLLLGPGQPWVSVELIPCLLRQPSEPALLGLLAIHGEKWTRAQVTAQGPAAWRIDPPAEQLGLTHLRAQVLASDNGQALLAIFHGSADSQAVIDQAWSQIAAGTRFSSTLDTAALLDNGAAAVQAFRQQTLARLLPQPREEEWWLWYSAASAPYIGWTHTRYASGKLANVRETRWREPRRERLLRVVQRWDSSPDLSQYSCLSDRYEARSAGEDRLVKVFQEQVMVQDHQLTALMRGKDNRLSSQATAAPVAVTAKRELAPHYLPGGWLPSLIGQLPRQPLVLQTESFLLLEGMALPDLVTLIIEPGDTAAHPATQPLPGSPPPAATREQVRSLRWVSVRVNGSGEISRWYYETEDGELQEIDFADGLKRVPTTSLQLQQDFDDIRMIPED